MQHQKIYTRQALSIGLWTGNVKARVSRRVKWQRRGMVPWWFHVIHGPIATVSLTVSHVCTSRENTVCLAHVYCLLYLWVATHFNWAKMQNDDKNTVFSRCTNVVLCGRPFRVSSWQRHVSRLIRINTIIINTIIMNTIIIHIIFMIHLRRLLVHGPRCGKLSWIPFDFVPREHYVEIVSWKVRRLGVDRVIDWCRWKCTRATRRDRNEKRATTKRRYRRTYR
jgi:hypothetical protein